jgi:hypothetical protein
MLLFATLIYFAFCESSGAQAAYPDRHDYAFGRRLCPLAHSRGMVGSPGGTDMLLPFAFVAGGLRPVVHWQDSSRHAPGQCVLDLAPTGTNSNRANRANRPLAALSNVGAEYRPFLPLSVETIDTHAHRSTHFRHHDPLANQLVPDT